MDADTHLKYALMELASAVSNETTVSVICFNVLVSACGPAARKNANCLKKAIWKKPLTPPKPWATTACKRAAAVMPCPTASRTAHPPSACNGSAAACKAATPRNATRLIHEPPNLPMPKAACTLVLMCRLLFYRHAPLVKGSLPP